MSLNTYNVHHRHYIDLQLLLPMIPDHLLIRHDQRLHEPLSAHRPFPPTRLFEASEAQGVVESWNLDV